MKTDSIRGESMTPREERVDDGHGWLAIASSLLGAALLVPCIAITSGCIETAEQPIVNAPAEIYQKQMPGDDGNMPVRDARRVAGHNVFRLTEPEAGPVAQILVTEGVESEAFPDNTETWRWAPEPMERIASGAMPAMGFALDGAGGELSKAETVNAFEEDTEGWSQWQCGRLFRFGAASTIRSAPEKGIIVYRLEPSSVPPNGLRHVLELRFDPSHPEMAPVALIHLDEVSVEKHLIDNDLDGPYPSKGDAEIGLTKATARMLQAGSQVDVVPLVPSGWRGHCGD